MKCVLIEADCLGSVRREHIERGVGRWRSAARLCPDRVGPTRPNQFGSNEVLKVERVKAVGNLLGRLPLVADELENVTISVFHKTTVLDSHGFPPPNRRIFESQALGLERRELGAELHVVVVAVGAVVNPGMILRPRSRFADRNANRDLQRWLQWCEITRSITP
jgi:hypothetical protein